MKKNFILLFILLGISIAAFAQSPVVWKNAVFEKGNMVKNIYKDNAGNIYACIFDKGPMNTIKGVWINKYSPELDFISKIELKGDLPNGFEVQFVLDYICILSKGSNILFYDISGNLVKKVDLDPEYNYSIITGNWASAIMNNDYSGIKKNSNISASYDQNNFTIWGYKKIGNPKNKLDKNNGIKLYAFDNKIEEFAEESFSFEDVFSNSAEINSLKFDITPQKKIVALCSNTPKPDQAKVYLAVFNEKDKSPVVYKYSFKYEDASFAYDFGKMGEIYISGVISVGGFRPSLKRTPDKTLYFISQSLSDSKAATPVVYSMEDQIYKTYSEYSGKLKVNSLDPFGIFVMDDGILFGAMEVLKVSKTTTTIGTMSSSSSSTYYYSKSFTFIKFSFTGKIQWLKMINKEVKFSDGYQKMAYFSYKKDGNKLKVVYCDNPANILNKSAKTINGAMFKTVPAYAEITSAGDISVVPLDKLGKKKMLSYPDESIISDKNIILLDVKIKGFFNLDYFIGSSLVP